MATPTGDTQFYSGHLWIMETGSWQIRFTVDGAQGPGILSVPLPATSSATRTMQPGLGALLAALGLLLVLGMIGIVGPQPAKPNCPRASPFRPPTAAAPPSP